MKTLEKPIIRTVGREPASWVGTSRFTYLANPTETNNEFSLIHSLVDQAGAPPPHVHSREDEVFYILRGEAKFLVGEEEFVGRAGDVVYLPRGIAHAPIPLTPEVEVLILLTPGEFVEYFREFSKPAMHDGLPAPHEAEFPDIADVLRVCNGLGITFLPAGGSLPGWPIPDVHAEPQHIASGSGERYGAHDSTISLKLNRRMTQGLFSLGQISTRAGAEWPVQTLRGHSLALYVLGGCYEITVEGITHKVEPGGFVYIPRDISYGFKNSGVGGGQMLVVAAGTEFEQSLVPSSGTPVRQ
jgi:quercetin dioxygenase-like cupin family protein